MYYTLYIYYNFLQQNGGDKNSVEEGCESEVEVVFIIIEICPASRMLSSAKKKWS